MGFKSDIEIAQEASPKKITEIAASLGIDEKSRTTRTPPTAS